MKMYHFNPNDYGMEFFVLSEDRTSAHQSLIKYLNNIINSGDYSAHHRQFDLASWINVDPNNPSTYPGKYTIDEHDPGHVVESEIC